MFVTCLDLEGVLVPEIWIAFAEETGIKELRLTTRDISDYDVLMKKRIAILKENGLKLSDIQKTIEKIDPMEGAKNFLDELRSVETRGTATDPRPGTPPGPRSPCVWRTMTVAPD